MPALPARLQRGWLGKWLARSLGNRIAFAAAGLTAGFVAAIGALSYFVTQNLLQHSVSVELGSQTRLVGERLEHALLTLSNSTDSMARSTLLGNSLVDSGGRSAYVEPFLREYRSPVSTAVAMNLTDHAGRVVAANTGGAALPLSTPWIRQTVDQGIPRAEVTESSEPRLVLAYPVIFPATGTAEGLLIVDVSLSALLAASTRDTASGNISLRAGNRPLVSAGVGRSDSGLDDEFGLHLTSPLDALDLRVVASRPWLDVYQPLIKLGSTYWLVSLVALSLAIWLAKLAATRVVAPLVELTEIADRNRRGSGKLESFPERGDDEIGRLGGALQDMVERVQSERDRLEQRVAERTAELNDLAYIVRRISNGVVVTDADGLVEWINEGFTRISGYTLDELRGRKPGAVLQGPETDAATVKEMSRALASGRGFSREILNYHKDGTAYWVAIDAQPILDADGRVTKFVALETDVTERRHMDQLKSEFVSVVSHELRTPLTAIRGSLGLLAGGVLGDLPESSREMVALALDNSKRLTHLIDDLLDIQKLEAGKMHFEFSVIPLADLVATAVAAIAPYATRHEVGIAVHGEMPPVPLRVDVGRFQQVMSNLLSNAIKYSPPGSEVGLSARLESGWARLNVADSGPGIPEEFRSRIFQKFSQADSSTTRAKQGTGLGLSIAKAMVEHMDGRIGFDSVPGQGCTFYVEFPAAA